MKFRWILPLVCVLVVAADLLFWDAPVGWTLGAFCGLLTALGAWRFRPALSRPVGRFALALAAAASVALFLEPGFVAFGLALCALLVLVQAARPAPKTSPEAWFVAACGAAVLAPFTLFSDASGAQKAKQWHGKRGTSTAWNWRRALLRWVLPVAGTLVFAWLFAQANPVWDEWMKTAWDKIVSLLRFPKWFSAARLLFWIAAGLCVFGLWRTRVRIRGDFTATDGKRGWSIPADIVIRSLALFTILFAVQLALDAGYLMLGAKLPHGMTHAQYAHRGAYPLVATALLAGLFTLAAFGSKGKAKDSPWARRLIALFIAQNILLLFTAAWRLFLYMDAFGWTRWRLAAAVWMALVGGGLALILAQVILRQTTLWLRWKIVAMALPTLLACAFFPVDRVIGAWNVAHCAELSPSDPGDENPRGALNVRYLETLGIEALPALREAEARFQAKGNPGAQEIREAVLRLQNELHGLRRDFRGWTPRRALLELPADYVPAPVPAFQERDELFETNRSRRGSWDAVIPSGAWLFLLFPLGFAAGLFFFVRWIAKMNHDTWAKAAAKAKATAAADLVKTTATTEAMAAVTQN